jgi:glycosyltransferase involved in cell wall biosynthesis
MARAVHSEKEKDGGKKPAPSNDAAEQLVLEITNSIAQRSVAARRRRASAQSAPVAPPAPATPPAPAVAPVTGQVAPVTTPAPSVEPTAPVEAHKPKADEKPAMVVPQVEAPPLPQFPPREADAAKPVVSSVPMIPVVAEQPAAKKAEAVAHAKPAKPSRSSPATASDARTLCVFCYEDADSVIGRYVINTSNYLASRGTVVHVFARSAFPSADAAVHVHAVGEDAGDDLIDRVRSFGRRATAAFDQQFARVPSNMVLMGHEWAAIPVLSEIAPRHDLRSVLSLHSLETQRSDMKSALSQEILKLEADGLKSATSVLIQENAAAAHAVATVGDCAKRLVYAYRPFATRPLVADLDPGAVKARYQIGPIDPTVLFVGDLDDRHGPDVLMKAIPQILKNIKQARFIFVGDGALQWPLRVHARYLLLEYAVRIVGHVGGDALLDLIQAADVIAVPSRQQTETWPILAAWAAKRPVLSTQAMAGKLLEHEVNSVVAYANENSMVWGVERLLFDENLRKKVADNGHAALETRFGWNCAAEQLETLMATVSA